MAEIPYNWEFVCTYQMLDDDPEMANFLYQIQVTTAFCMKKNLLDMMRDTNPETNVFESSRVQEVFDYLVDIMHLHENTKFVDILKKHPMVTTMVSTDGAVTKDTSSKQIVKNCLLWLISFHSFHAFHRCIIDIATTRDVQSISDENLKLLESSFNDDRQ